MTNNRIISIVADEFGLTLGALRGRRRRRREATARHTACLVLRLRGRSYVQIGDALNRDHSTAVHSVQVADQRYAIDESYRSRVERVLSLCGGPRKIYDANVLAPLAWRALAREAGWSQR